MKKLSTLALFAFILPLAGCPGDDGGEEETGAATTAPTTETDGPTTETDGPTTETDGPATDGTADGDTEDPPPGGPGACNTQCEAPADCGMPDTDWECNDGFCDFIGEVPPPMPCDPAMCDDLMIGVCAEVEGVSVCTFPCTDGGGECDAFMLECTGQDDAGNDICAAPPCFGAAPGELCEIPMFGAIGTCQDDGSCTCESDEECTADGFGCDPTPGGA